MAANPQPSDLRFVQLLRRVRCGGPQLVLVGLDRADSLGVLAGLPDLLDREPDIEIVCYGELAAHGAAYPLQQHDRATVIRSLPLDQLLWLVAASTVLVSDDPGLVTDAPGLGTPGGAGRRPAHPAAGRLDPQHPQPGRDGHRSGRCSRRDRSLPVEPSDGMEARARRAGRGLDVRAVPVAAAQRTLPVQHRRLTR